MTFRLPEIQVSDRLYTIAKIMVLVFIFLVFVIGVLSAPDANSVEEPYKFVYCLNEVTNTTITYPEGTDCDYSDDVLKDEQEHEEWSEDNDDSE
jgi:hypothetical protein